MLAWSACWRSPAADFVEGGRGAGCDMIAPMTPESRWLARGSASATTFSADRRLMKEWLTVGPALDVRWVPLAAEALEFVGSKG